MEYREDDAGGNDAGGGDMILNNHLGACYRLESLVLESLVGNLMAENFQYSMPQVCELAI